MTKELYRTEDESGLIVVTEQADKRILSFASDLQQSCIYKHKPYYLVHEYTQIMLLGLVFVKAKNTALNVTILGLGGGGLVQCLQYFYSQLEIQVVEIRQAVIDIAYEWFYLPEVKNLHVHCADANDYIKQTKPASIELLLSDLYEAQGMSETQVQADFIAECYKALSDNGWMVINFHSLPENTSPVMKAIKSLFLEVYVCDVYKGNWVLFCGKTKLSFNKTEF